MATLPSVPHIPQLQMSVAVAGKTRPRQSARLLRGRREGGDVELPFRPADLNRARLLGRVSVTLGGSIAGQPWEIRVGMGEDIAGDRGQPAGHQATPAAVQAVREQVPLDSGTPRRAQAPARKSMAMGNFWDSLDAEQRVAFRAKAQKRVFAAGARLMQEGEHGDHVAVILSGLTQIRVCENGTERVVAERGPGQLIGERAALEMNPRSATVVARQTVVALAMSTADFAAFVSTYPGVLKIVEQQIYTRLREGRIGRRYDLGDDPAGERAELEPAGSRHIGRTAPLPLAGHNCTVVRTDVKEFGARRRDAEAQRIIRQANLTMTRLALGPVWPTCRWEDRGDGLLVIVAPDIPTGPVIERLATVLAAQLKRHNRTYSESSRIQLRVAVEVGPIEEDEPGVTGNSIVAVSRMLDSLAFKQAIDDVDAALGLIVSPYIFEAHVRPGGISLDPAEFTEVPVRVKETHGSGWMRLIGADGAVVPQRTLLQCWRRLACEGNAPQAQDGQRQLVISGASSPCSRV